MKTIEQLKKEIFDVTYKLQNESMKKSAETKLRNRIAFLKVCVRYVESNPDQSFCEKELKKIEDIISSKMKEFEDSISDEKKEKMSKKVLSGLRKEHEAMYGLSKLRVQMRSLRFILS